MSFQVVANHTSWKDVVIFSVRDNLFKRKYNPKSVNEGKYFFYGDKLILEWNKWGNDVLLQKSGTVYNSESMIINFETNIDQLIRHPPATDAAAAPVVVPEPVVEVVVVPEPVVETVPEPVVEVVVVPEQVVEAVPEPAVEAVAVPEPAVETVPEPAVETVVVPEPSVETVVVPEPAVETVVPEPVVETVVPEPVVETVYDPVPMADIETGNEPQAMEYFNSTFQLLDTNDQTPVNKNKKNKNKKH